MDGRKQNNMLTLALIAGVIVALILVLGSFLMGRSASDGTEAAVSTISRSYLNELAGRRVQVVSDNLERNIGIIYDAVELLKEEEISEVPELQKFQAKIKKLFDLERFAFVDSEGHVYTSLGIKEDIADYKFDYKTISGPEISIKDLESENKKVIIAVPVKDLQLGDKTLVACFMELDMEVMLEGVSLKSQDTGYTFCNIYTSDGVALTNTVLGGQAPGTNLLEALGKAEFDYGYSYEQIKDDFSEGRKGVVSFNYSDIKETLSYTPVNRTDWMLSYLVRESVISDQISSVTNRILHRSVIQSILTALVLIGLFSIIIMQTRKASRIALEKETAEAENRIKHEELEQRLALQAKLIEKEQQQLRQGNLINALSADFWSVYYLDLDNDRGICYRSHSDLENGFKVGEEFNYLESVTGYANGYVTEKYREKFLEFVQPENIRKGLAETPVISYTYMVERHGRELYEMVRFARANNRDSGSQDNISSVGACFSDVDEETREALARNEALSTALDSAEEANKAKTSFLLNMSHEIRTPMNAIIGLNNIALNDEETPEKTKGYLVKLGDSAEHLLNLINDILDMSRIESGRMVFKNEEFSFSKLIEAINTMFTEQCRNNGLEYSSHIIGHVDDYYIGDNMKLRQVLINILGNAVKFTPAGGKVDFSAERTAKYNGKSTLCFTISDTGIGMSKEYIPHIFDTFSQEDASATNKFGSTGLGMAITKNMVELMNGNIEVESEKGVGTTFKVKVTLLDSERYSGEDGGLEIDPQEMKVLVIDDEPVDCEHAKIILEQVGIACDIAPSGEKAVEMVKLRHARRDPYNLILVDWRMPEKDGIAVTREIRDIVGHESAIIILTAYRWDDVADEALEAGVDSFISKPLFASGVLEEFNDALKKKNMHIKAGEKKADLTGRRVLLAEDIQINAEIMEIVLQSRQITMEHAENGRIAVEMFRDHPQGYYDAILMDMRMPEMDGLEATKIIRAEDRPDAKTIPIIALTANAFDEDVQRSLQAGLNAHLSKPVRAEDVYETLEILIRDDPDNADCEKSI